ncbi:uncharacterized protein BO97DRAFT_455765 [Aspergillus homomorphus CBS 101889]|uniref:Uncharacterized protein n=1 Tax=Aspergillus homomorphus (strain CBS 101889) TaxID=1450537 RepID=A0A395I7S3_ASPHC|nr:hypothetical protein BO97DRAFT_455765 [Aspergillus homomorphus CBS 101889]RAL16270.1 hypothetical protein BO97DRAFT_455765 [Aspergillus homomorphus CBS 101889]
MSEDPSTAECAAKSRGRYNPDLRKNFQIIGGAGLQCYSRQLKCLVCGDIVADHASCIRRHVKCCSANAEKRIAAENSADPRASLEVVTWTKAQKTELRSNFHIVEPTQPVKCHRCLACGKDNVKGSRTELVQHIQRYPSTRAKYREMDAEHLNTTRAQKFLKRYLDAADTHWMCPGCRPIFPRTEEMQHRRECAFFRCYFCHRYRLPSAELKSHLRTCGSSKKNKSKQRLRALVAKPEGYEPTLGRCNACATSVPLTELEQHRRERIFLYCDAYKTAKIHTGAWESHVCTCSKRVEGTFGYCNACAASVPLTELERQAKIFPVAWENHVRMCPRRAVDDVAPGTMPVPDPPVPDPSHLGQGASGLMPVLDWLSEQNTSEMMPVPDPRLLEQGSAALSGSHFSSGTEIPFDNIL